MNLLELLKRPEGKTLEFKRDLSSPDGVLRSLVAFANTSGGTVLVGVEDRTRHVRGVSEPLDLLRDGAGHMTSEIATTINLTPRATRTRLLRPVERGLVREVGTSPQDPKRRYFLSN